MGVSALLGHAGPWTLLLLTFAMGVGSAWNAPAYSATIPELVGREDLPAAVTLNSVQFNAARAVGPAIGGILLIAISPGAVFLINAASFLVVIALIRSWKKKDTPQTYTPLMPFMREGIRFVRNDAKMRLTIRRAIFLVFGGSALWALLPSVARQLIHTTGDGFGLMLGSLGLGAVLSGVVLARSRSSLSERQLLALGAIGFSFATLGLSFCHDNLHVAFPLLVIGGISWMIMMSTLNVAAQSALPDALRARGLSIYILVFNGSMAFGSWFWGQMAEYFTLPHGLWAASAALLLSLVFLGPNLQAE